MRVLFSCRPAYGHLYPLMPLAVALREAGHEVVFATGEAFLPRLERLGFPAYRSGESIGWAEDQVRRGLGEQRRMAHLEDEDRLRIGAAMFGELLPRGVLADLVPLLRAVQPDLIVYEESDVGAALAAACTPIPAIRHALSPAEYPPPMMAEMRRVLTAVQREHGGAVRAIDPLAGDAYLDICPPATRLGGEPADAIRIPLRPVAWNEPGAPVPPSFLEPGGRPRAYVTLGTVVFGAVEAIRAAVAGLTRVGAEVVVAAGPDGDPSALGSTGPRVHVERFVDQAALLPHLDLVVSHGGAGTMLGAFANGVPQLALPQGADQFANAESLVRVGAGLRLLPQKVTPEAIDTAIGDLLASDRHRAGAARLRDEIASMPAPGEVIPALVDLART